MKPDNQLLIGFYRHLITCTVAQKSCSGFDFGWKMVFRTFQDECITSANQIFSVTCQPKTLRLLQSFLKKNFCLLPEKSTANSKIVVISTDIKSEEEINLLIIRVVDTVFLPCVELGLSRAESPGVFIILGVFRNAE